jgi:hypothetical protein
VAESNAAGLDYSIGQQAISIVTGAMEQQGTVRAALDQQSTQTLQAIQNAPAGTINSGNYTAHAQQAELFRRTCEQIIADIRGATTNFQGFEEGATSTYQGLGGGGITAGMA